MNSYLTLVAVILVVVEVSGDPSSDDLASIDKRSVPNLGINYGYAHGAYAYGTPGYKVAIANYGLPLAHSVVGHPIFKRSANPNENSDYQPSKRSVNVHGVNYGYTHGAYAYVAPAYGVGFAHANYGFPVAHPVIGHQIFKRSADLNGEETRSEQPSKRSVNVHGVNYGYTHGAYAYGAPAYGVGFAHANYGFPVAHPVIGHHILKRSVDLNEEETRSEQPSKRSVGAIHTVSTFPVYGHSAHGLSHYGLGHVLPAPLSFGHHVYKRSVPLYQTILPAVTYGAHTLHSYHGLNGVSLHHGLGHTLGHLYKRSISPLHGAIPLYGYGHGIHAYHGLGHVATPIGVTLHHGVGHHLFKRSLAAFPHAVTPYTFQHAVLGYNEGVHGISHGLHGYTQGFTHGVLY